MIVFRLDANPSVATGHMFRCISIAKQCRKAGKECLFFFAEESYTEILSKEGFSYCVLNLKWDDWDYGIDIVREYLQKYQAECLVVDSYRVTAKFFEELAEEVPIFYLDDLCVQPYRVTVALHYSEWEQEHVLADLYAGTHTRVYAGMKYMPLREGFAQENTESQKQYDILITTGGSDTYHVTKQLIQRILKDSCLREKSVCAVLGKMNPDKEEIYGIAKNYDNIVVMENISNMDEIMRQSRYAVTAGGTSVYELMASGVLFVCFGFSDDQKYFGERLEQNGNALWAGDAREDVGRAVCNLVDCLKKMHAMKPDEQQKRIQINKALIDGNGATRIAEIIIGMCKEKDKAGE